MPVAACTCNKHAFNQMRGCGQSYVIEFVLELSHISELLMLSGISKAVEEPLRLCGVECARISFLGQFLGKLLQIIR